MVALFIRQAFVHPILGDLAIWAETVSVPSGPHPSDLGLLASTVLAAVFVMAGIYRIRKDRLSAIEHVRTAIPVQILLIQVFASYNEHLAALAERSFSICVLLVRRYAISMELISRSVCDA